MERFSSGGDRHRRREDRLDWRRPGAQVGHWYLRRDTGGYFQITDIDEHTRSIEIQTFEGDLDEIDLDSWSRLPLERAQPPEDWTGPLDVSADDLDGRLSETGQFDGTVALEAIAAPESSWDEMSSEEDADTDPVDSR